jgi:hypothetical protein
LHARRVFGRALLTSRREAEQEERKAGKGESEKGKKEKERYEYVMKKKGAGARRAVCGVRRPRVLGRTANNCLEARASVAGNEG